MSQFYGGAGVEVLYPSQMMNPHQFSEPESWNAPSLMPLQTHDFEPKYESKYEPTYSAPHRPPPIEISHISSHMLPLSRPKSSPSTFGPNVEDLLFTENPYRMRTNTATATSGEDYPTTMFSMSPQPIPSTKAHSPYYPPSEYPISSCSGSPGRTAPIAIAPDPVGLRQINAMKRMRDEEDQYVEYGQKKRKRALSNVGPVELNEEEQLLLKLKEEENLPWKDIAVRFQSDLGKAYQVPALQMRFKRLRERMRTWTDTDVQALEQAYDYWEKFQFDIIAAKMLDFGASERWPAKYCARKWEEIHPGRGPYSAQSTNFLRDPWENASPVDSTISQHHSPRVATM